MYACEAQNNPLRQGTCKEYCTLLRDVHGSTDDAPITVASAWHFAWISVCLHSPRSGLSWVPSDSCVVQVRAATAGCDRLESSPVGPSFLCQDGQRQALL